MKVLLISSAVLPVPVPGYGGLEQIVFDLAIALRDLGHKVSVLAVSYSKLPADIEFIDGGEAGKTNEAMMLDIIRKRIHQGDWDIIHDHSWQKIIYLDKKNNPNLKVISTLHGMNPYGSPPPVQYPNMVCLSKDHALRTSGTLGINTRWVYNGLNTEFYRFNLKKGDRMLFLGRFMPGKGAHIAVDIANRLKIPLDLVGDDVMTIEKDYVKRIMKSAMDSNGLITYWGPVPRERAVEFFGAARLFLQCGCGPWCIIPGQSITTNQGLKNIEEIQINDQVLSEDGRYHKVLHKMNKSYNDSVVKIFPSLHNMPITISPEHKLLVIKGKRCSSIGNKGEKLVCTPNYKSKNCSRCLKFKPLRFPRWDKYCHAKESLERGENPREIRKRLQISPTTFYYWFGGNSKWSTKPYLPIKKPYWKYYKPEWKTAKELSEDPKDYYLISPFNILVNDIDSIEDIPINKSTLRMFGYYAAEGYSTVYKNNKGACTGFCFGNKDKDFVEETINTLEKYLDINANLQKRELKRRGEFTHHVYFGRKPLNLKFREWFGHGARNKKIPQWIFQLPNNKIAWFLQGLWRGDGCVSKRGEYHYFSYSTVSKTLAYQLFDILLRFKIFPNLLLHRQGKRSFGKNPIYVINVNGDSSRFADLLEWEGFKESRNDRRWKSLGFFIEDKLYIPIRKIESGKYNGLVYDISVDKTKNFCCEQIVVKNSEPFGLVTVESLCCGTPVVALNNGATPEIINNKDIKSGFICNDSDEIVELIKSGEVDKIKPEDCRKRGEQFDRKFMAQNYMTLYNEIMEGREC